MTRCDDDSGPPNKLSHAFENQLFLTLVSTAGNYDLFVFSQPEFAAPFCELFFAPVRQFEIELDVAADDELVSVDPQLAEVIALAFILADDQVQHAQQPAREVAAP